MDKPVSLSMKAWIIRNMSVKILTQESIIETVINHQFETALRALDECNSLEFSGFGKFFFNRPKAFKKLERLKTLIIELNNIIENENETEIRKKNAQIKLDITKKCFDFLNNKVNGIVTYIRGMEESTVPSERIEGTNSESEEREDGNM